MKKLFCLVPVLALLLTGCVSIMQEEPTLPPLTAQTPLAFQETVVVENATCQVKVTGIDPGAPEGYTVELYLENRTDERILFFLTNAALNSVVSVPDFSTELSANQTATYQIPFTDKALTQLVGIVTDVSLSVRVAYPDSWITDPIAAVTAHIYPYGEQYATAYVRPAQEGDRLLVDNERVAAIVTGWEETADGGFAVNVYLVNKTKNTVLFCAEKVTLNQIMTRPVFDREIEPGCTDFTQILWSAEDLQVLDGDPIKLIEMSLVAYNTNSPQISEFANVPVVLEP